MARYLVIEFADNESADKLMAKINDARAQGALYRVVGLFVKPRRYCECPGWRRTNYGDKNQPYEVALGSKYGWWVCTNCNRPRRAGHQLVNQLKGEDLYEEPSDGDIEMIVTGLQVYGQEKTLLNRLKVKRRK